MRNLSELNNYRIMTSDGLGDGGCGAFLIKRKGVALRIVASDGMGWDHVSVSTPNRIPTWEEMEFVKRKFFRDNEVAMQLHVATDDHINHNARTLHIWRPHSVPIPLPPKVMV